jgi:cystathionine beta-lyase/cystathionine gamma-synthase
VQERKNNPMPDFDAIVTDVENHAAHKSSPVVTPIYQNSLFTFSSVREMACAFHSKGDAPYYYSREHNPTVEETEREVAALEGAETARAFSSGMAAITAAVLGSVSAGGRVVTIDSVYWPAKKLWNYHGLVDTFSLRHRHLLHSELLVVGGTPVTQSRV